MVNYLGDFNMADSVGKVVAGRYRLVRTLGGDAAFRRWLAYDFELGGESVELSPLPPEVASSGRAMAAVRSAAILSLKLLHTNIASARAFNEEGTVPFFVFDHVEGMNLSECLDEWGRLGEDETKALLAPLASALDYAHAKDIVHCDVRPSNVIVDGDIVPHFIGFCVSREIRDALARTRGGAAAGPVSWLSPEQLAGMAPTPAQDIYSLAAIAYECMAGHPPFHRGQIEYQIANAEPAPLSPETPFTRAVMRALSKNPAERPETCAEMMAGDIARIEIPEVVAAVPVRIPKVRKAPPPPAPPPARRPERRPAPLPPQGFTPQGFPPQVLPPHSAAQPRNHSAPPIPVHASRKAPTEAELAARRKRLAEVEDRRRRQREAQERQERIQNETEAFQDTQSRKATKTAMLALGALVAAIVGVVAVSAMLQEPNVELANAPAKKSFSQEDLDRFAKFGDIEFGRVVNPLPSKGDPIVFGETTNTVGGVSLDGRHFEVELSQPVFKVFPTVRVALVDTPEGKRISGLTFEKNGEGIKADKARKVVAKIASLMEKEYGIDMGETKTIINDTYFGQRFGNDFIDIRISSVVSPDSTSISFTVENRAVRAMEIVVLR